MKFQSLFLLMLSLLTFSLTAQNNSKPVPVLISGDGTNLYEGVEANYQLVKCGGEPTVLLSLNNTTTKKLKATWVTVIQSNDNESHYAPGPSAFIVPAKSEVKGECGGNKQQLQIKLSEFGVAEKDFQTIIGSNFNVVPE